MRKSVRYQVTITADSGFSRFDVTGASIQESDSKWMLMLLFVSNVLVSVVSFTFVHLSGENKSTVPTHGVTMS